MVSSVFGEGTEFKFAVNITQSIQKAPTALSSLKKKKV